MKWNAGKNRVNLLATAWPTIAEQREVLVGQRTQWLVPYRDRHTHLVQHTPRQPPQGPLDRTEEALQARLDRTEEELQARLRVLIYQAKILQGVGKTPARKPQYSPFGMRETITPAERRRLLGGRWRR